MTATPDEPAFSDYEPADSHTPRTSNIDYDPESVAQRFHEIKMIFESKTGPIIAWNDLREEDRAIATEMMRLLGEWLEAEGSL